MVVILRKHSIRTWKYYKKMQFIASFFDKILCQNGFICYNLVEIK